MLFQSKQTFVQNFTANSLPTANYWIKWFSCVWIRTRTLELSCNWTW